VIKLFLKKYSPINIIFIVAIGANLTACEKSLNLKLTEEPVISLEDFENTEGLELPYQLNIPNSITGWSLGKLTQFTFDPKRKVYSIDNIPLNQAPVDDGGYRFKICSSSWKYQFGFGTYITDDESTIGIAPNVDTIVRIERFSQPSTDIRLELPTKKATATTSSENSQSAPTNDISQQMLRVEFKLIRWEPSPQALLRLTLYTPQTPVK